MIKECKVLLNNKDAIVVDFDGNQIQLPPIKTNASVLNIMYENGRYRVVSNIVKETAELKRSKKKRHENTNDKKEIAKKES